MLTTCPASIICIQEHADSTILEAKDYEDYRVIEHFYRFGEKRGLKSTLAFMARVYDKENKKRCIHYYKTLASEEIECKGCSTPIFLVEFGLPHGSRLRILNI